MTKDNFLFGIIGLMAGLIIGFTVANKVNQDALTRVAPATSNPNSNVPPGHPPIGESDPTGGGMQPQVQAAIENARQNPDDFEAQLKAAELYYQIQKFDGAIEFLKKANKLKPDDYETLINLGNTYFDSGNYADAEKWYSAALAKKPDDINVRTDLGLTFIFREPPDYDRAIKEFARSLEKDPNHIQTLQNLTVAYTKKGDAAKAKETLARLETADASNSAIPKLREEIAKIDSK